MASGVEQDDKQGCYAAKSVPATLTNMFTFSTSGPALRPAQALGLNAAATWTAL